MRNRRRGAERYIQMCRNNNISPQEILAVLKTVFLLSDQTTADLLRKA